MTAPAARRVVELVASLEERVKLRCDAGRLPPARGPARRSGHVAEAYGERGAALIPLGYSVLSLASLSIVFRFRRYAPFRQVQLCMILVAPFALQLALGGWLDSSAVIFWSPIAVTMALLFGGPREALSWFACRDSEGRQQAMAAGSRRACRSGSPVRTLSEQPDPARWGH